jgi:hypothetical protein
VTHEGYLVLDALNWLERHLPDPPPLMPIKRIAIGALAGDEGTADRTVAELGIEGYLASDTMGWQRGRLTPKGHMALADGAA